MVTTIYRHRNLSSEFRTLAFSSLAQSNPFSISKIATTTKTSLIRYQSRLIESESEYHSIADETLETIQDTVDSFFDMKNEIEYEVSYSSGVLSISFPPHGTWVLNKQTPNRQIWVSYFIQIQK
jgi:Frataxin-like domain